MDLIPTSTINIYIDIVYYVKINDKKSVMMKKKAFFLYLPRNKTKAQIFDGQ